MKGKSKSDKREMKHPPSHTSPETTTASDASALFLAQY